MKWISALLIFILIACAPQQPVEERQQTVLQPSENIARTITVEEGELVTLGIAAYDPDGDPVNLTFSLPVNAAGQWQTKVGDAGIYDITVTASDGTLTTTKYIRIIVRPENKPPRIKPIPNVQIRVGDTLRFEPEVEDPNNDTIILSYEGWMNASEKIAGQQDLGVQQVTVIAFDGRLSDRVTVNVTVLPPNQPPVIEPLPSITVFEGDTIRLNPRVTDADNDAITITYSGFMSSDTYTTTYEDAGMHEVTITASDGVRNDVKKVTIVVKDRPRAPEIVLE